MQLPAAIPCGHLLTTCAADVSPTLQLSCTPNYVTLNRWGPAPMPAGSMLALPLLIASTQWLLLLVVLLLVDMTGGTGATSSCYGCCDAVCAMQHLTDQAVCGHVDHGIG